MGPGAPAAQTRRPGAEPPRDVVLRAGAAPVAPWPWIPSAPRAGLLRCLASPGGIQVGSGAEDRALPEQSLGRRQSDVPAEPASNAAPGCRPAL